MPDRPYDLVVFGATGYTGRLVAEAVRRRAPAGLRWALAGRDRSRLDAVARTLGSVPTIVADVRDPGSLEQLARSTRALLTTVGPYARYGMPVVAACAHAGTHYADLTGEPTWIREVIDAHDTTARASGARIVPASGFDSLPSDLGVWLLQQAAIARTGRPVRTIVHAYGPMSGGVSGGTIASGLDLMEQLTDADARAALSDPDLLAPGGTPSADPMGPLRPTRYDGVPGWTAPFVMASANGKVVRRTRFLAGEPWGDEVRYLERVTLPTWARAAALTLGLGVAIGLLSTGPARRLAERWLPGPGEGPPPATRDRGFFRSTMVGYDEAGAAIVRGGWDASGDPGYAATSRMLAEMGLVLASDPPHGLGDVAGGVLTPARAGGHRLAQRLAEVEIRFHMADPTDPAGSAISSHSRGGAQGVG